MLPIDLPALLAFDSGFSRAFLFRFLSESGRWNESSETGKVSRYPITRSRGQAECQYPASSVTNGSMRSGSDVLDLKGPFFDM